MRTTLRPAIELLSAKEITEVIGLGRTSAESIDLLHRVGLRACNGKKKKKR